MVVAASSEGVAGGADALAGGQDGRAAVRAETGVAGQKPARPARPAAGAGGARPDPDGDRVNRQAEQAAQKEQFGPAAGFVQARAEQLRVGRI